MFSKKQTFIFTDYWDLGNIPILVLQIENFLNKNKNFHDF
jgi:hypothetical protein